MNTGLVWYSMIIRVCFYLLMDLRFHLCQSVWRICIPTRKVDLSSHHVWAVLASNWRSCSGLKFRTTLVFQVLTRVQWGSENRKFTYQNGSHFKLNVQFSNGWAKAIVPTIRKPNIQNGCHLFGFQNGQAVWYSNGQAVWYSKGVYYLAYSNIQQYLTYLK